MSRAELRAERMLKGAASHRRLEMLKLLLAEPDLTLRALTRRTRVEYRTGSEHLRKLAIAGLIFKYRRGREVCHRITDRGRAVLAFCDTELIRHPSRPPTP